MSIVVGTAGWSIPRLESENFPPDGTSLERYATRFAGVEINSSFHRAHRLSTWQRWHDSVPGDFRFSVKVPKQITHLSKLANSSDELDSFLAQVAVLGSKLAVLLVQLAPKHPLEEETATRFFTDLAARTPSSIACEPRHESWFTPEADCLLKELRVARVAADPAISDAARRPGGWLGLSYWRLHGSPVKYRSSYRKRIPEYAAEIEDNAAGSEELWCIFDNTASSAAVGDALTLMAQLGLRRGVRAA
jgi:uncharacterized protein YecE (DUF72 family)